jgi:hypothetical protein
VKPAVGFNESRFSTPFKVESLPNIRQGAHIAVLVGEDCSSAMKGDLELTKRYRAIFFVNASIRRITFEALSLEEAQRLAANWGFGLEGEVTEDPPTESRRPLVMEAFDVASACRVLGDISRTTLYRLLVRGQLERLPATRKVLVTRRSIERFCSKAA